MINIQYILDNTDIVRQNSQERYSTADVDKTIQLYNTLKKERQELQEISRRSNEISASFKDADEKQKASLRKETSLLKEASSSLNQNIAVINTEYVAELLKIPNLTASDVPQGKTDEDNVPKKFVGEPPKFDFTPLDHIELGKRLDVIDFKSASKVTGSKFYFLKNEAVLLELGLIRYALDLAMKHGFVPMMPPELARNDIVQASGFNPRGHESQIYSIEGTDLSLIGTSEITIGGYMSKSVVAEKDLPIKFAGISHCFRTEAGSAGQLNKGLYRVHQFSKVELYQFSHPDMSADALEQILEIEEEFYTSLGLPYRVMLMCKGDLGSPAYKKYDIEAWMPFIGSSGGYGEVTSVSNCTDFQARRLNVKFKDEATGEKRFVHTLNGTAVAVTRTMLAIIENNQQSDGSILIPEVLHKYTGITSIMPK